MNAAERVAEIKAELAARDAKIVALHWQGQSVKDIAADLELPWATVNSVLDRRVRAP